MREVEYDFLDEITLRLKAEFGQIRFLEIGVCGGNTVRGMYRRGKAIDCPTHCAGVDFEQYRPKPSPGDGYEFFAGDTMDMWRKIGGTFNLLLVDGCHCVNHSMADFLNYSTFVVVGGYCLFHDTAVGRDPVHIQDTFGQNHSYAGQPDSVLGVREGLYKTGLLQGYRADWKLVREIVNNESTTMGMILFQKVKPLK